jgi:hypothetical protein
MSPNLFTSCSNKAIVEYLENEGERFAESAAAFRREAGLEATDCEGQGVRSNLLARKWTIVARLQKQITQLEGEIASKKGGDAGSRAISAAVARRKDFLPAKTPRSVLAGHRGAVLVRRCG